jgi:hypothetical protein
MALASSVAPANPREGVTSLPWVRFGLRRLGRLLASLWVLVTASFLMIHLIPGDPVRAALGPTAPVALVEAKREEMGLDDPILVQYWHYLQNLLHGDFGTSMLSRLEVQDVIAQRLPATLQLAVLGFLLAILIAVPLGVTMGVLTRRGHGRRTEQPQLDLEDGVQKAGQGFGALLEQAVDDQLVDRADGGAEDVRRGRRQLHRRAELLGDRRVRLCQAIGEALMHRVAALQRRRPGAEHLDQEGAREGGVVSQQLQVDLGAGARALQQPAGACLGLADRTQERLDARVVGGQEALLLVGEVLVERAA